MIVEIDADNRLIANSLFDLDDIDSAFEELDARYLAGEASAHAHTWSILTDANAALNRRELPATTPDYVLVDNRPLAMIEAVDLSSYFDAGWKLTPQARMRIAAVHRLTNLGAVITWATNAISQQGFEAEWWQPSVVMIEGDMINRAELFDAADIDRALARFEELNSPAPQLENAATRARARAADPYNRRDVEGFVALAHGRYEDRRKGLRDEGAADAKFAHAVLSETPRSWRLEIEPVAIRGDRLALTHEVFRDIDHADRPITVELMTLTEVADDELVSYTVFFDPDDINGALEELDARYLAGEADTNAQTWSVIARAYAALNRRELPPATPDWVNIDRRRLAMIEAGGLTASIRAAWDLAPDSGIYIETVHRLSKLGAVLTWAGHGTSQGFEAESRGISIMTVEGDLISLCELFDEVDIDAALARFAELNRPA
jgi:hypothetical protein